MAKFMKCLSIVLSVMFLLSSVGFAQDTERVMADFYNGLANVIERNMSSPDSCLYETERFIQNNQGAIDQMHEAARKGKEEAKDNKYSKMSQAEIKEITKTFSNSIVAQALNRWTEALMAFSTEYPDHASKMSGMFESLTKESD